LLASFSLILLLILLLPLLPLLTSTIVSSSCCHFSPLHPQWKRPFRRWLWVGLLLQHQGQDSSLKSELKILII
jgi:hypothetical protein